jgi:hypothetical protein
MLTGPGGVDRHMRTIHRLDPAGLPGGMLKHGVALPLLYLLDGMCMPVM